MQNITIFPVLPVLGAPRFRAVTKSGHSEGSTVGEALDRVRTQVSDDSSGTVVVIQPFEPDDLFTTAQQRRLSELMERWRNARDGNGTIGTNDSQELEALVDLELKAAAERTSRMLKGIGA